MAAVIPIIQAAATILAAHRGGRHRQGTRCQARRALRDHRVLNKTLALKSAYF